MKKLLAILLSASMLIGVTGCKITDDTIETDEVETTETVESTTSEVPAETSIEETTVPDDPIASLVEQKDYRAAVNTAIDNHEKQSGIVLVSEVKTGPDTTGTLSLYGNDDLAMITVQNNTDKTITNAYIGFFGFGENNTFMNPIDSLNLVNGYPFKEIQFKEDIEISSGSSASLRINYNSELCPGGVVAFVYGYKLADGTQVIYDIYNTVDELIRRSYHNATTCKELDDKYFADDADIKAITEIEDKDSCGVKILDGTVYFGFNPSSDGKANSGGLVIVPAGNPNSTLEITIHSDIAEDITGLEVYVMKYSNNWASPQAGYVSTLTRPEAVTYFTIEDIALSKGDSISQYILVNANKNETFHTIIKSYTTKDGTVHANPTATDWCEYICTGLS